MFDQVGRDKSDGPERKKYHYTGTNRESYRVTTSVNDSKGRNKGTGNVFETMWEEIGRKQVVLQNLWGI